MDDSTLNLTGQWSGLFNYPEQFLAGAFEANLIEISGIVSGATNESGQCEQDFHLSVSAHIEGQRANNSVSFTKFYDSPLPDYLPVEYTGKLSPEGDELSGVWQVSAAWSGTFIMIRKAQAVLELTNKESALANIVVPSPHLGTVP
jgi:hypothetical protein